MAKRRDGDGITRRDFLDGVAVTAAGLAAAAASPHLIGAEAMMAGHGGTCARCRRATTRRPPPDHRPAGRRRRRHDQDRRPPAAAAPRTRPRGGPGILPFNARDTGDDTTPSSSAPARAASPRRSTTATASATDSDDPADRLAARLRRPRAPQRVRHPRRDQGGADVMLLRNGGTVNLDSIGAWNQPQGGQLDIPGSYGQPAVDMLGFLGITRTTSPQLRAGHPVVLRPALDAAVPARGLGRRTTSCRAKQGSQSWPDFLATTPYSPRGAGRHATIMNDDDDRLDHIASTARRPTRRRRRSSRDHLQAVPDGLRRRQRGGDRLPPAHVARPVRRRHPGSAGGRHLGAGQPGLRRARPHRRHLPGHRPHRPAGLMPEQRPDAAPGRTATPRCCGCSSAS